MLPLCTPRSIASRLGKCCYSPAAWVEAFGLNLDDSRRPGNCHRHRCGMLLILFSRCGYSNGPAWGRMAGGSIGPSDSFRVAGTVFSVPLVRRFAGQGACGRALILAQAATIASAHGQVAAIRRRAGARCRQARGRAAPGSAAPWARRNQVAVQGQRATPGKQRHSDQGGGQPHRVDLRVADGK
jgi:hypothetical protein